MERRLYDISWAALWRILVFVTLVAILYQGRQIILGLFLAIIISSGIEGLVDILERVGLPRSVGVIFIFLAVLLLLILVVYAVVPIVIVELNTIMTTASKGGLGSLGGFLNLQASPSVSGAVSRLSAQFLSTSASPLDFLSNAVGSLGLATAVVISSFYLSLGRDGVERFIETVIPRDYEDAAMKIYRRSRKLIGAWFRTQILLSCVMGFTVWAGLTILGVKYAFLIAVLAAIFEIVPFLGPILSAAVAVVSAFSDSSTLALYTLIFFLVAQQFESNILVPLFTRRSVGLHPVIVIVAILIGAEVGGLLGIVISVPAAAVFQEVIQEWSTKKRAPVAA